MKPGWNWVCFNLHIMKKLLPYLLLLLMIVAACRSQKNRSDLPTPPPDVVTNFNSNECFVRAKILEVVQDSSDTLGPCKEHDCLAKVNVIKVIRCGKMDDDPPFNGDTMIVRFIYTMSSNVDELFPKLTHNLSGLEPGDRFDAIWKFRSVMVSREDVNDEFYPIIYDYVNLGE